MTIKKMTHKSGNWRTITNLAVGLLTIALVQVQSFAADAPAWLSGWSMNGFFDASYTWNFNKPKRTVTAGGTTVPLTNNSSVLYNGYHNMIALNLAEITIKKTGKDVSFLADLDFGHNAEMNAAGGTAGGAGGFTPEAASKHLGQAYITYTPNSSWSFDLGKMYTHVGLEVAKSKDNWQYSRSYIYSFGMPIWHTGLHVGYNAMPDTLTVGLYAYNGWNSVNDNNESKTYGGQLKWTPTKDTTVIFNYIEGAEQAQRAQKKKIYELNVTHNYSSDLAFALELLDGVEQGVDVTEGSVTGSSTTFNKNARWRGASVHAKYNVSSSYYISPRYEIFRDVEGYAIGNNHYQQNTAGTVNTTGNPMTVNSLTITNSFNLAEGLDLKVEGRYDSSSSSAAFGKYDDTPVSTDTRRKKTQMLGTLAVNYSF